MMRNTVTGTISQTKRIKNSVSGNPRYAITLVNNGTYRTAADHAFVYEGVPLDGRVILILNGRGTITGWMRA